MRSKLDHCSILRDGRGRVVASLGCFCLCVKLLNLGGDLVITLLTPHYHGTGKHKYQQRETRRRLMFHRKGGEAHRSKL
jgi:hypothetical protein